MLKIASTNELKTSVTYAADGSQTTYNIPFDYLRNSFVKAKITKDGTPMTYGEDYTISNRQILFTEAPVGELIIYRETITDRIVQFVEGSVLRANDMNISTIQQLHIIEEAQDWSKENSIVLDEEDNAWEGRNNRIKNVADPVDAQDVVTKAYIENVKTGFISVMTTTKDECVNTINSTKNSAVSEITKEVNTIKEDAEIAAANSQNSAELAEKWAQSPNSPDGVAGNKSSKTWAQEASDSADKALKAAESVGNPFIDIEEVDGVITFTRGSGGTVAVDSIAKDSEGNTIKNTYAMLPPDYYYRENFFTVSASTVTIPAGTKVIINGALYISTSDTVLNTSTVGAATARAGKDVYIYACAPTSGTVPVFVLSLNSTVPTGYTAETSRKIGGFHCLAVAVGTISGHTLSGWAQGAILPKTAWDLIHRPACDSPEGMFYVPETDTWMDIYGVSWDGSKLVSVYGGTWADGTSSKKWQGEATLEQLLAQGKRLPWRHEFQMAAKGSNEQTNISGSADPGTTGGHNDTAGRRMISNYGGEDMCGVLWHWVMDLGFAGGSGWTDSVYNSAVDSRSYGQTYGNLYRLLVGGDWGCGSHCGSRCATCASVSATVYAHYGARGASEPLFRNALKRKTA